MEDNSKTTVSKNKTAKVGEKYSYQYVDIAQIHEYLESIDARYYQYIDRIDGDDYIITVPIIGGVEQAPRRGCRIVDATLIGVNNPAQQQGSALTYARRYSLLMAFGLATEDDDAASLTRKKTTTQTTKPTPNTTDYKKLLANELQKQGKLEEFAKKHKLNAKTSQERCKELLEQLKRGNNATSNNR